MIFLRGVLARGLAERFRRLFDIENVVDDLEREADVLAEAGERGKLLVVAPA